MISVNPYDELPFKSLPIEWTAPERFALASLLHGGLRQLGAAALADRGVIDLHGPHVGRPIVLMFEGADPAKAVMVGVLREGRGLAEQPGPMKVDADGERLIVSAKEQVVLRFGKESITLTKAGMVLMQGTYVLSRSSDVNRIKGGSVQIH